MAVFVSLGEVCNALDVVQNCRLDGKDVHGRGLVGLGRWLVCAGECASDGRHVVDLFLCEEIGL